jgi:membrane protein required for colicin V production
MTFHTPDFVILGLILLSILIGIIRGLIKESISLITWVVAITLAVLFASPFSQYMTFTKMAFLQTLSAFLIIFVGSVFIGAIFNFIIGSFVRKTPFSFADRILGAIFGFLRGILFVGILILLGGLTPLPTTPWWQKSYVISKFQVFAIWLKERLPEENAKAFHFGNERKKGAK